MNILLTSVGRRAYLVQFFKKVLGGSGKVVAINSVPDTPGMFEADKAFVAPKIDSESYIDFVCQVVEKNNIKLVLSLFDIDLPYLAKNKSKIEKFGAKVIVSSMEVIDICNDKWKTADFCNKKDLPFPKSYLFLKEAESDLKTQALSLPVIIKPRWGMGSLSVYKANDIDELRFYYALIKKQVKESYLSILSSKQIDESVMIQQCISGTEFGLDVFNDLNSGYVQTVVKKKIAMRSGETDMAEIFSGHSLEKVGKEISATLKHIGNLDVDIMLSEEGIPFVIEFNARFGGGYPFSHLAGADFPAKLIQMVKSPNLGVTKSSILSLKAFKDITPRPIL